MKERSSPIVSEADTDGVYFAVPATWQEEDERALVAEIAAELPPKIVLEYDKDSRAAAMFSHEVKNYALLRYDGTLVMHGRRGAPAGTSRLGCVFCAAP